MPRAKAKRSSAATRQSDRSAGASQQDWQYIPRLVVFDLDFTLWFPEMYELDGSPFRKNASTGVVTDRSGEEVHFFPAVHNVMDTLVNDERFKNTTEIAMASRTTEPQWAKTCMRLMDLDLSSRKVSLQSVTDYEAIYPRNKRVHFEQLKNDSGVEYEDMLFFDNEYSNVVDVGRLGVVCAYCPRGLSEGSWLQGMEAFQEAKRKATQSGSS